MNCFSRSVKLFYSKSRYIPDLYHIVLNILIAASLVATILYLIKNKGIKEIMPATIDYE